MASEAAVSTRVFADRVADAVERKRSQLVVGLDPRPDLLPVELAGDAHLARSAAADASARFCRGIVDAVASHAVAVKPQLAFFEALGADGIRAFEDVCQYARSAGLLVIADAKRGDIGSTSRAYAAAYLEPAAQPPVRESGVPVEGKPARSEWEVPPAEWHGSPVADAMTVNPYLGSDSIEPFLAACRRHGGGIFCLVKTSNEGGADVQDVSLSDGRPLWHHIARLVADWGDELVGQRGLSSVGAVVGATHPRAVGEARRMLPQAILLLPGVGAQGATPGDVARAFTSGPASALVSSARSVLYGFRSSGLDWRTGAASEAARLKKEIWSTSGW